MNAKLCKHLRRMARQMSFNVETNESTLARRLMVHPGHEKRFKFQGSVQGITAVNDPKTTRGVYRWLKRNHENV